MLASAHLASRPNNTDGNTAQTNGDTESLMIIMMMMMMIIMIMTVKIIMEVSIDAIIFGEIVLFSHFKFHHGPHKLRVHFAFTNQNSMILFHVQLLATVGI